MSSALLYWFRLAVYLLMTYMIFDLVRTMVKRGRILPSNPKEWRGLASDILSIGGIVFVLFILKKNYEAPIEAVMQFKGKPLPAASFFNLKTGKEESLEQYADKTVILNIWATWCGPCRREMPELDKLAKEFTGTGKEVIALSDEDAATIQRYLEGHPLDMPVGFFTTSNTLLQSIQTRPVSILLKNNRVVDIVVGSRGYGFFHDWLVMDGK